MTQEEETNIHQTDNLFQVPHVTNRNEVTTVTRASERERLWYVTGRTEGLEEIREGERGQGLEG